MRFKKRKKNSNANNLQENNRKEEVKTQQVLLHLMLLEEKRKNYKIYNFKLKTDFGAFQMICLSVIVCFLPLKSN